MSESEVEKERKTEQDDIAATSYVNGQYSIPNCIDVLKILKDSKILRDNSFISYALELIKDRENRVIVVSLKDQMDILANWLQFKYRKDRIQHKEISAIKATQSEIIDALEIQSATISASVLKIVPVQFFCHLQAPAYSQRLCQARVHSNVLFLGCMSCFSVACSKVAPSLDLMTQLHVVGPLGKQHASTKAQYYTILVSLTCENSSTKLAAPHNLHRLELLLL
ncbi:unnamed protein product [Vicia faba]|uniref:Uncharacterized protein n=1 Tax=Vicia faba TaxID=3906 RepID=A0AAV1AVJ3_VICFA|nr:unnamed protein product [Vicia faba]CAI8613883.1 unnamed protein product [Vicia faba]